MIAEIVARVIHYHPDSSGVKRAKQLCEAWIANSDENVRFYAAFGLKGNNPGLFARTFKDLSDNGSPEMRKSVDDLTDEWGLE